MRIPTELKTISNHEAIGYGCIKGFTEGDAGNAVARGNGSLLLPLLYIVVIVVVAFQR